MRIQLYLVCRNEMVLLPHTVKHYRDNLGADLEIIILDNYSNDDSRDLAEQLGCNRIRTWGSLFEIDDFKLRNLKNDAWQHETPEWVIMCDMDEWLCCTREDLELEWAAGTHVLRTRGYEIIGKSQKITLNDIDLHSLNTGVFSKQMSKSICFSPLRIREMNYSIGAHQCDPVPREEGAEVIWSTNNYVMKHMNFLGIPYIIQKNRSRYRRSKKMREQHQLATHYRETNEEIINIYKSYLRWSSNII